MQMLVQRRISEIVPQENDPSLVLICHSGNQGLLVPTNFGIKENDIVAFYGTHMAQPIQAIQVVSTENSLIQYLR